MLESTMRHSNSRGIPLFPSRCSPVLSRGRFNQSLIRVFVFSFVLSCSISDASNRSRTLDVPTIKRRDVYALIRRLFRDSE